MNVLIDKIKARCTGKQLFITTHSAYVLNSLGLDKLVLVNGGKVCFLRSLSDDTKKYFRKLSGYDTLRLILATKTILVEGPSDDLVVQRAHREVHGKLPIEAGTDVINVRGLSFPRFLEIAKELNVPTIVVTDNDGDYATNVVAKYAGYVAHKHIRICADSDNSLVTLEDHVLKCNGLAPLNALFGTKHITDERMLKYMKANKSEWALKVFDAPSPIVFPKYILDAVAK